MIAQYVRQSATYKGIHYRLTNLLRPEARKYAISDDTLSRNMQGGRSIYQESAAFARHTQALFLG